MSIITGSATVPASSTTAVFFLPPGYCNMTLFLGASTQNVWVGTSAHVASTNGMLVPPTPLSTETFVGSAGAMMYATTGNATASSFSYILSTAH